MIGVLIALTYVLQLLGLLGIAVAIALLVELGKES